MVQDSIGTVFMSYSRRDEDVMKRILIHLRSRGILVWLDNEKLTPGTPIWEEEIENAISTSSAVVVILSPDAKASTWVRREITYAEQYRKNIFPILVRGDELSAIPIRLINFQYADIRYEETKTLATLGETIATHLMAFIKLGKAIRQGKTRPIITESDQDKALMIILERLHQNPVITTMTLIKILWNDTNDSTPQWAILLEYRQHLNNEFNKGLDQNDRISPLLIVAIYLIDEKFGHWISPPSPTPATAQEKTLYSELLKKVFSPRAIEALIELESKYSPNSRREELLEIINRKWDADFTQAMG